MKEVWIRFHKEIYTLWMSIALIHCLPCASAFFIAKVDFIFAVASIVHTILSRLCLCTYCILVSRIHFLRANGKFNKSSACKELSRSNTSTRKEETLLLFFCTLFTCRQGSTVCFVVFMCCTLFWGEEHAETMPSPVPLHFYPSHNMVFICATQAGKV